MIAEFKKVWPASLHHLCLSTEQIDVKLHWYQNALGMRTQQLDSSTWLLSGGQRRLLLKSGPSGDFDYVAFAVQEAAHLTVLQDMFRAANIELLEYNSPLFQNNSLAIGDPDGNVLLFGLVKTTNTTADKLPGRLQHIGITSANVAVMQAFYVDQLGFRISDIVKDENDDVTASFIRSDPEHHSIAIFRAAQSRLDHIAHETSCWNDIRDWGDHLAGHRIAVEWGAGRHGAGNNLFIFVRDPDGLAVEFSAELQTCPYDYQPGHWHHEERTLNLWGSAWMRS